MHHQQQHQLRNRLELLADDVGRLRRRLDPETSSLSHLGDRIAGHVHCLFGLVEPTAAELVAWHSPQDDAAVNAALEHVDHRDSHLTSRLGGRP